MIRRTLLGGLLAAVAMFALVPTAAVAVAADRAAPAPVVATIPHSPHTLLPAAASRRATPVDVLHVVGFGASVRRWVPAGALLPIGGTVQKSDGPSPLDGPIFEQVVDRALDSPGLGAAGAGPSREGLRARALEEHERLAGVAAAEYDDYLETLAAAVGRDGPPHGDDAGKERILSALAVLVPSLGAVATGVFLLCGFGLRAFAVRPHIGDGLVMAGVIAAAVTAGAALGDLGWLLVTGVRGRAGRGGGGGGAAQGDPEVRRARAAWEHAVLERGLMPFLAECAGAGPVGARSSHAGSTSAGSLSAGSTSAGSLHAGSTSAGSMDPDRMEGDRVDPGLADPECPEPEHGDRRQAGEARTVGAEERAQ